MVRNLLPVLLTICIGASATKMGNLNTFGDPGVDMFKQHLLQGYSLEITTAEQTENLKKLSRGILAVVSKTCGHCKDLVDIWDEIALQGKGQVMLATIDIDNKDTQEYLSKLGEIEGTPAVFVYQYGQIPRRFPNEANKEMLSGLIDRLTYEMLISVDSSSQLEEFVEEANEDKSERAYYVANVVDQKHHDSVMETLEYARSQAYMHIKLAACTGEFTKECAGIKKGTIMMLSHKLPAAARGKDGSVVFSNLDDARATHIFIRGAQLPPAAFVNHEQTFAHLTHYESATIPVVFLFDGELRDDFYTVAWKFLGKAVILAFGSDGYMVRGSSAWRERLQQRERVSSSKDPAVYICKFLSSHVCYEMKDQLSADNATAATQMETFINDFLEDKLQFTPRSEPLTTYVSTNKKYNPVLSWIVGSEYESWLSAPERVNTMRVVLLTHAQCAQCPKLIAPLEKLASDLVANDALVRIPLHTKIQFAMMDTTYNDPPPSVEMHSYPRTIIYAAGDSTKAYTISFQEIDEMIKKMVEDLKEGKDKKPKKKKKKKKTKKTKKKEENEKKAKKTTKSGGTAKGGEKTEL